jgi:nicotinate-nucleotide pyrophosphorylase (carboxylating)
MQSAMNTPPRSHDPDAAISLPADLARTVAMAIDEDVGNGDLTAALVPAGRRGRATVITREAAIIAGRPYVDEVFRQIDPSVHVE